jgi:hypothetical protein
MSLRCSLLGHEYGESEIERDREERGDEVVLSVTELERCTRCGNARIISENTEVTQRSPRDTAAFDSSTSTSASATGSTLEPDSRESVAPATGTDSGSQSADPGFGAGAAVDADDADLIGTEEDDDRPDPGPGSWPEHDDEPVAPGASREWPSVGDDDEGFDASVPDGEPTNLEFGGGLTPQADQGAEILEAESSPGNGDADVEFVRSERSFAPDRTVEIEGETELYCPGCDASDLDDRESLRAGDICPDCRRGYLAERER